MLKVLNPFNPHEPFPEVETALTDPPGLLAVGGCLSTTRLAEAYRNGIFPWYSENEPLLWWSPDPRMVLWPEQLKISKSLGKRMRRGEFILSHDRDFNAVIDACANVRPGSKGTWITPEIKRAYNLLHEEGQAHSFEAWQSGQLVGGLYGIAIGRMFFGESMFHTVTDASKAAFVHACQCLSEWGYGLIDCQVHSEHLESLGARLIPRSEFMAALLKLRDESPASLAWASREDQI